MWTEVIGVTSPHTISSLVAETEYEVQWRAVSSAGDGEWSPSATITTAAVDLMPSLPTIFSQSATVGTAFSLTFSAATGGDPPLTYTVSAAILHGLPCLVSLCQARRTATGTHQVRVTVEDDDGDTAFRAFILTVSAAADLTPTLPAIANQSATVGTVFSLTFSAATGGDSPLAYTVSGNPAWLTLSDRTLSGTPTATGTHTVEVTVEDDDGDTDSSSFTLTVSAAAVLLTLADFVVPSGHDEVDAALITSGLDADGWLYRSDTGALGTLEDGSLFPEDLYEITRIRHFGTNLLQLNDNPNAAHVGDFFDTGGTGNDLTIHIQDATGVTSFVVADETISASSGGFVRWTVPAAFETVLARIALNDLFIFAFTRPATVDLMPSAPSVANQTGTVGTAFSETLPIGTGGDTPLAYSVSGEPAWASFNATTRVLSGTPDATGTTTVTYTVEDDDGDTDSTTFDIVVSAAANTAPINRNHDRNFNCRWRISNDYQWNSQRYRRRQWIGDSHGQHHAWHSVHARQHFWHVVAYPDRSCGDGSAAEHGSHCHGYRFW